MGEIIKHIFEFIFLRTKKNSLKIFYLISIILAVLLINNYFSISKGILIDRKLTQLQKLHEIAPERIKDSSIQVEISTIQKQILDKSTFIEKVGHFINSLFIGIFTWRSFSACTIFLMGMIISPYLTFKGNPQNSFFKNLVLLLFVEFVFAVICLILIKLLGLIAEFKHIWANHLINLGFQFLLLLPFYRNGNTKN